MNFLKKFLKIAGKIYKVALHIILLCVLVAIVLPLVIKNKPKVHDNSILKISIGENIISDYHAKTPLVNQNESLADILLSIEHAKKDNRIKAILVDIKGSLIGVAHAQELRESLKKFKANGKKVYAFASSFGELSNATSAYYLACASDKIFMQPLGTMNLTGFYMEAPFVREAFDKHKIIPQMEVRENYKTASHTYIHKDMTPENKEQTIRILTSLTSLLTHDIAIDRKLTKEQKDVLFDDAPYLDFEAKKLGLVTELIFLSQVYDVLDKEYGAPELESKLQDKTNELTPKAHYISPAHYLKCIDPLDSIEKKIAIVYIEGPIVTEGNHNVISSDQMASYSDFFVALKEIKDNKNIKAVVIRVNSPGGSASASLAFYNDIMRIKAKKPVVVSMGNYAASGGYLLSCGVDHIVAQPGTLTGSIGVYGGKIVTGEFWRQFGINWQGVAVSQNADMWSNSLTYSQKAQEKSKKSVDQIYEDFMNRVAKGRRMSAQKTHDLAQGKVYTGQEALALGLVDSLGGLDKAVSIARDLAKFAKDEKMEILYYPKAKTMAEIIAEIFGSAEISLKAMAKLQVFVTMLNDTMKSLGFNSMHLAGQNHNDQLKNDITIQ